MQKYILLLLGFFALSAWAAASGEITFYSVVSSDSNNRCSTSVASGTGAANATKAASTGTNPVTTPNPAKPANSSLACVGITVGSETAATYYKAACLENGKATLTRQTAAASGSTNNCPSDLTANTRIYTINGRCALQATSGDIAVSGTESSAPAWSATLPAVYNDCAQPAFGFYTDATAGCGTLVAEGTAADGQVNYNTIIDGGCLRIRTSATANDYYKASCQLDGSATFTPQTNSSCLAASTAAVVSITSRDADDVTGCKSATLGAQIKRVTNLCPQPNTAQCVGCSSVFGTCKIKADGSGSQCVCDTGYSGANCTVAPKDSSAAPLTAGFAIVSFFAAFFL